MNPLNWNVAQLVGAVIMVAALVGYLLSLASTIRSQASGQRVSTLNARLRIGVFGFVFFGAGTFVLASGVTWIVAVTLWITGGLIVLFASGIRLR